MLVRKSSGLGALVIVSILSAVPDANAQNIRPSEEPPWEPCPAPCSVSWEAECVQPDCPAGAVAWALAGVGRRRTERLGRQCSTQGGSDTDATAVRLHRSVRW